MLTVYLSVHLTLSLPVVSPAPAGVRADAGDCGSVQAVPCADTALVISPVSAGVGADAGGCSSGQAVCGTDAAKGVPVSTLPVAGPLLRMAPLAGGCPAVLCTQAVQDLPGTVVNLLELTGSIPRLPYLGYRTLSTIPALPFLVNHTRSTILSYHSWFTIPRLPYMVYQTWATIPGLPYLCYHTWFTIHGLPYLVYNLPILVNRNYQVQIIVN